MALVALVLALRHLEIFYSRAQVLHLHLLVQQLRQLDRGVPWSLGEELGNTGLFLGGPLYLWLNLPARWLSDNPVLGLHLLYFALELLCIMAWFYWPAGRILHRRVRWLSALALALAPESKLFVCQNDTMMGLLAIPLFITFLAAQRPDRGRAMVLPGVLAGLAIAVHQAGVVVLPLLLLATVLLNRERWLTRSLVGLGSMLAVLALLSLPSLVVDA